MTSWIFQANPDTYDIDAVLEAGLTDLLFSAAQNSSKMRPGDTVYLWRSKGRKAQSVSGVIAKGHLTDTPSERRDNRVELQYWVDKDRAQEVRSRVNLHIERIASKKEVLKREWMEDDPVLESLQILKMANSTNFLLSEEHAKRLEELWKNTGEDWTRAQCVAALMVYDQTYGGSLSLKKDAPIAVEAVRIGRVVKGFYNKVLNFRALDPRDSRAGFSGAGAMDRKVWNDYYDPATKLLDRARLLAEYKANELAPMDFGEKPKATIENENSSLVSDGNTTAEHHRPGPIPSSGTSEVSRKTHDEWFVYILELSNKKAIKVGMSHNPADRLKSYNHAILTEITGLRWRLAFTHKVPSAEAAQALEQTVLNAFSDQRLESNGEVLRGVGALEAQLELVRLVST